MTTPAQSGRENEHSKIMIDQNKSEFLDDMCFAMMKKIEINNEVKDSMAPNPLDMDRFEDPPSFKAAWDHPDEYQRVRWRKAIKKELDLMQKMKVWKIIKKKEIPEGRRCVKNKWVFNIKRNGIFWARLVACGYTQIPGVDFMENYAPVIHDVTYRIMLVLGMILKYDMLIMDIETAFLNGDLKEEIYMDSPKGLECQEDEALLLVKTIYGLVQSAREYFRKFITILKKIGFTGGTIDPCLMMRKNQHGIVYIAIYVDDCLLLGDKKAIEKVVEDVKKEGLNVKIEESMGDYLSCNIKFNKDKTKAWLGQPHQLKKLESTFGKLVEGMPKYKTPGTPNMNVMRPEKEDDEVVSEEHQKLYRSGVGMLLYLVKHSRPDIANVTRELSKCMDKATPEAFKELKRAIKFVLDTKNYGLKIEPKADPKALVWNMVCYCDSDYAGDRATQKSVSGFILFLMGVAILWRSKAQQSVTLSSSEAEYVSLSEAAKDVKFVYQILQTMNIKVKTPIVVRVDNVGAIFMSENIATTGRAKHVDIRYRFVNEMVGEEFLKIVFVKTKENYADGLTKNVTGEIYDVHVEEYISDKSKLDV